LYRPVQREAGRACNPGIPSGTSRRRPLTGRSNGPAPADEQIRHPTRAISRALDIPSDMPVPGRKASNFPARSDRPAARCRPPSLPSPSWVEPSHSTYLIAAEAEGHAERRRCIKIRPRRCLRGLDRDCQPCEELLITARRAADLYASARSALGQMQRPDRDILACPAGRCASSSRLGSALARVRPDGLVRVGLALCACRSVLVCRAARRRA
jgi:hypothetical protein